MDRDAAGKHVETGKKCSTVRMVKAAVSGLVSDEDAAAVGDAVAAWGKDSAMGRVPVTVKEAWALERDEVLVWDKAVVRMMTLKPRPKATPQHQLSRITARQVNSPRC